MNTERTEDEIYRVLNWADEGIDRGSKYSGASYEQGVSDAIRWLIGDSDHAPDEEE